MLTSITFGLNFYRKVGYYFSWITFLTVSVKLYGVCAEKFMFLLQSCFGNPTEWVWGLTTSWHQRGRTRNPNFSNVWNGGGGKIFLLGKRLSWNVDDTLLVVYRKFEYNVRYKLPSSNSDVIVAKVCCLYLHLLFFVQITLTCLLNLSSSISKLPSICKKNSSATFQSYP